MKLLFSKSLKICVSIDSIGLLVSSVSIYFYCYVCFPSFQLYRMHVALGYQKFTPKKKQIWKRVCYFISKKMVWTLNGFHSVKKNFSVIPICTSLAKKIAKWMSSVWWNETQPNSFIPGQRLSNILSVIHKRSNDRRATIEYCMMTKHLIIR